ncbi:MAG: bifunctional UDP-N-acetylglucosamine diphosphorylase/glucosamine-1-phosphate N-acetyltransferase GlmU [Syntrophomonadaceae bacterium]|nr:bifunctional UDP-N-acetylglucosamine diphosphorylase/glucosamine-1-phosphate N-acetyltransferase GlmU [Syntrophomonadaceae bacterium]
MQDVVAVVLAAGKGTRMISDLPKVMHRAGGKYLVQHVLDTLSAAGVSRVVLVVGHGANLVQEGLGDGYRYVRQAEQLGTGHAVAQVEKAVDPAERNVLVVCGDMPLLKSSTLQKLIEQHRQREAAATVLTARVRNPVGYGRVLRDPHNHLQRIVEEKDATAGEKEIEEVNTGTYCFDRDSLFSALKKIEPHNVQQEYYLTDVLPILQGKGLRVEILEGAEEEEALGVNSRQQLAEVEQILRQRTLQRIMVEGVTIVDPGTTFIDAEVSIAPDTIIYPFTFLEGKTRIGGKCELGPMTRIVNSVLGNGIRVQNSIILDSQIEDDCNIGPFAYLRPETYLARGVKVGDFVELKKSRVGENSKIPHLSYVGDAIVGVGVNIGCGTITCNYDGVNKHPTIIEDGAFIGSNSNLVAPIKIGAYATTGAGSTITKDVPDQGLAVERSKQKIISNWSQRRGKE